MNYIEITRAEAKERYEKGKSFFVLPCNINTSFCVPFRITKELCEICKTDCETVCNNFSKANIKYGDTLKFYKTKSQGRTNK